MSEAEDLWGVVANVAAPHRFLRMGAKVWILWWTGGGDRAKVYGLSRGGRSVTTWVQLKKLSDFRVKWVPEPMRQHSMFLDLRADKELVEREAEAMRFVANGRQAA